MTSPLQPLSVVLEDVDDRLKKGTHASKRVWPTGFELLDGYLNGGFRSGELVLLAGPQGMGKTTWALQTASHMAGAGRSVVYFSFEHDAQTLLERLIAMEAAQNNGIEAVGLNRVRAAFEAMDGREGGLVERLQDGKGAREALETVSEYASRVLVFQSSGATTSIDVVREIIDKAREATGQLPFVVVDYLQKVYVPGGPAIEDERITTVVEGLKDVSLELDVPVLAIVAADKEGVAAGHRMRMHHMRGSTALAYEADTVLVLNEKYDVVARHHLIYDIGGAERFHEWAVMSIEKNRNGLDHVDLEFQKRFEHGRFERHAGMVSERLVDERVFLE